MPLSKIPGTVLHLPMNEQNGTTANDNSRYGNDGSLGGGDADKMPVWSEHGLLFDGVDDYVDCGNDASLDITDAITISAWIKGSVTGAQQIVYKGGYATGYYLSISADKARIKIDDGIHDFYTTSTMGVMDNNWHHIAGIINGRTNVFVYVDGIEGHTSVGTLSDVGDISNNAALWVGKYATAAFNGTMADVRIYNRALSASEITDLYSERRHLYD